MKYLKFNRRLQRNTEKLFVKKQNYDTQNQIYSKIEAEEKHGISFVLTFPIYHLRYHLYYHSMEYHLSFPCSK